MPEYLPHLLVFIAALGSQIITIRIHKTRQAADDAVADASKTATEVKDRAKFREHLMQDISSLVARLDICEKNCRKCEEEHQQTTEKLMRLEVRLESIAGAK